MKREQQKQEMMHKILESAILEFNTHDYHNASMNHICQRANISKGIIYHYFENKDALYLKCVSICFQELTHFYESYEYDFHDIHACLSKRMHLKMMFFNEHPQLKDLFYHAILKAPKHLKSDVKQLKQHYDTYNLTFLKQLIANHPIKNHLSIDEIVEFLSVQLNTFNEYFEYDDHHEHDLDTIITEHDEKVKTWLKIILYGITEEEHA